MPTLPVELQPDEHALLVCRRHWLRLYPLLVAQALAAIVPVALLFAVGGRVVDLEGTARNVAIAASVLWCGYWLVRGYFTWFRYQHDVWVVTDQRLIDGLRRHWFHRQVASADLVDIEDVSVHRSGLLPTMFDFGDLRVQTAGEQSNFVLAGIPHPAHVLTVVDAARDAARRQLRGA
jgi:hypothetical protein